MKESFQPERQRPENLHEVCEQAFAKAQEYEDRGSQIYIATTSDSECIRLQLLPDNYDILLGRPLAENGKIAYWIDRLHRSRAVYSPYETLEVLKSDPAQLYERKKGSSEPTPQSRDLSQVIMAYIENAQLSAFRLKDSPAPPNPVF